jgi:small-conductance mechanosensitive channel
MSTPAFDFVAWINDVWTNWHVLIRIVAIVILTLIVRAVALVSVRRVVTSIVTGVRGKGTKSVQKKSHVMSPLDNERLIQRTSTLGSVLSNFTTWSINVIAITMILQELGVQVGALIAGAGILGAAIGFGSQSLVKDLISGLLIVFEDQFGVGDTVDLGDAKGVVENVGLRVTQVRDGDGTLWYLRNGEIIRVGNQSQGKPKVVVDIVVPYDTDVAAAVDVIFEAAKANAGSTELQDDVAGDPEVWGFNSLSGDNIAIRVVQPVKPGKNDGVARALRAAIKPAMDAAGIKLASTANPIHVVVNGSAK